MSKKVLLPKDLAARAEKVAPEKVEAEVKRIVEGSKHVPDSLRDYLQNAQAAQLGPVWPDAMQQQGIPYWVDLYGQQQAIAEERRREERERRRRNSMIGGFPWGNLF